MKDKKWIEARNDAVKRLLDSNNGQLPRGYTIDFINTLSTPVLKSLGIWNPKTWEAIQ